MVRYRVVETWKGTYRPNLFSHKTPEGCLFVNPWTGKEGPKEGWEVIFFVSGNQLTSFVVSGGKVIYASTSWDWGMRQEYRVEAFKKAVMTAVERQTKQDAEAKPFRWEQQ